jgi:hypothetical protein
MSVTAIPADVVLASESGIWAISGHYLPETDDIEPTTRAVSMRASVKLRRSEEAEGIYP